jgi:hypothetical protein
VVSIGMHVVGGVGLYDSWPAVVGHVFEFHWERGQGSVFDA